MNKPKISVIMSVYNAEENQLFKSISSILNQTFSDFELIIAIDDNNSRNTFEYIKHNFQDTRIHVYINDRNLKLANSLNGLIQKASGEYIARMDHDDISKPYRLQEELDYLEKNSLDIVAGNIEVIDENDSLLYCYNSPITYQRLYENFELPHPTWLLKKNIYDELNGYRNLQPIEDLDFLIRAKLSGKKFGVIDKVLLSYRITTNSISRKSKLKQKYLRKYLLSKEKEGITPSIEEITTYINSLSISEKDSEDYSKSRYYYNKAIAAKYHNQKLKYYSYILFSLLVSKKAREFRFKK